MRVATLKRGYGESVEESLTRAKIVNCGSCSGKKGKRQYSWSGARQFNGVQFHETESISAHEGLLYGTK